MCGVFHFKRVKATLSIDYKIHLHYHNRGVANQDLGNYRQAIEDYGKVIEIKPDFKDAYRNRGIMYCTLSNNYEAVNDLKTAQRFDELGVNDLKTAAKFGDELVKNLLRKKEINW